MQSIRFLSLIIVSLLIVLASGCKKDNEEPDPTTAENTGGGNTTLGTMSATIGNSYYSADNAVARFRTNGQLTIKSIDNEDRSLFFVINNFSGTLTYTMNPSSPNSLDYEYNFGVQNIHFSTTNNGVGELTITEYNQSEQLLSGSFSFTAGQTGSPENIIEVVDGEFNNIPITTLQQSAAGEGFFYYNDQLYQADSVKAVLKPPFTLEVSLYHEAIGGWHQSFRRFHTYPNHEQYSIGLFNEGPNPWDVLSSSFNTNYSEENETISQSMKLVDHYELYYDFEYMISEIPVSTPYITESYTVNVWSDLPNLNDMILTEAYLSPDENGNYELTATNDFGNTVTITNISEGPITNPVEIANHSATAYIEASFGSPQFFGACFWQESELGAGFYSIEFIAHESQFGAPIIVGKDIPISE